MAGHTAKTIPVILPMDIRGQAITDPLGMYKISDTDDSGDPCYFGYLAHNGAWYIMKQNIAAKSFRYCAGASDYATAWATRASLPYSYFDSVF